ncbi:uncharacterized protein LOC115763803 [Drosophila novamexicana]|uniref:uncharacterized protein LOC115763803 n=1 Tax=Drosophila novamexicana TaxID=47314 RepID=UPI0011E5E0D9|nr:uncharacterized protein LOC115763803 [Drosophila novamexicana]
MALAETLFLQLLLLGANLSRSWALASTEKQCIDFRDIRVMGEEHSLNGTVHILEDMDARHFQMSADFQHDPKRNHIWKPMIFFVPSMDICSGLRVFFENYGKTTLRQGENTNLPFTGRDCPLSQGTYFVKNMLINSDNWPGIIPFGGMRVNLRFYKQYKFVGGLSLTFNVERQLL